MASLILAVFLGYLGLISTGFLVFAGILFVYSLYGFQQYYKRQTSPEEDSQHSILQMQEAVNDSSKKTIQLEALNKNYYVCCYQTARIGEQYCPCGRAVDTELVNYLNT